MSDKCGNCDCADSTQCVKKGNTLVIETEKRYISSVVVEALAENDGKCKCGASVHAIILGQEKQYKLHNSTNSERIDLEVG